MGKRKPLPNLKRISKEVILDAINNSTSYNEPRDNNYFFEHDGRYYRSIQVVDKAVNDNRCRSVQGWKANNLLDELGFQVFDKREDNPKLKDKTDDKKCIILNKMFTGGYLYNSDNIGHEVINLCEADDSKVYLYLNSMGTVDIKRLEKHTSMLMVKKVTRERKLEIIALAKELEVVDGATYKNINRATEIQSNITYGRVSAATIMKNNRLPGGRDGANIIASFVTQKENIWIPSMPIFLYWGESQEEDKGIIKLGRKEAFPSTSMRVYYYEKKEGNKKGTKEENKEGNKGYSELVKLIDDDSRWKKPTDSETSFFSKVENVESLSFDDSFNIFRVSGNENDELSFSNMLAYFFNDIAFCKYFFEKLGINGIELISNSIQREEFDIDILIRGKQSLVVIENKIHSSINGKVLFEEPQSKIEKWEKDAWKNEDGETIEKQYTLINDKNKTVSQLAKYYIYAKSRMMIEYNSNGEPIMLLFCPDYSSGKINEEILKNTYLCGDSYRVIYYSEIYGIFQQYYKCKEGNHNPFFTYMLEFLNAMKKHINKVDNNYEEEMYRRFRNAIYNEKHLNKDD